MDKICFVIQRYGLEVNGGSELYCRLLAEKLTAYYQVEVFTTCATDYITWKNEYASGTETINGVLVHRFPTARERDLKQFDKISEVVFSDKPHSDQDELRWIQAQGPICDSLLRKLRSVHREYRAVIFMTYLYYLTARGLPMGFENALLIPTLHDEPPAHLRYFQKVFEPAKGFIWNSPAEKRFAERRFQNIKNTPGILAGIGVDVPSGELPALPEILRGRDYILYAGRIDESKGCRKMFNSFLDYRLEYERDVQLVVIGKEVLKVPADDSIVYLGFVTDEEKFSLLRHAKALVLFSEFESLSMVVLESMMMGRPVLVNGNCEVLKEHCILSNAGFYFYNYREFAEELEYLLSHGDDYQKMCENGIAYVKKNYRWDVIIGKVRGLIEETAGRIPSE